MLVSSKTSSATCFLSYIHMAFAQHSLLYYRQAEDSSISRPLFLLALKSEKRENSLSFMDHVFTFLPCETCINIWQTRELHFCFGLDMKLILSCKSKGIQENSVSCPFQLWIFKDLREDNINDQPMEFQLNKKLGNDRKILDTASCTAICVNLNTTVGKPNQSKANKFFASSELWI